MSAFELAVEELKALPPNKLAKAIEFIHGLREKSLNERNEALRKTAGVLTKEEADEWESAIRDDCRKIDAEQW
jgi:hypothetical protein